MQADGGGEVEVGVAAAEGIDEGHEGVAAAGGPVAVELEFVGWGEPDGGVDEVDEVDDVVGEGVDGEAAAEHDFVFDVDDGGDAHALWGWAAEVDGAFGQGLAVGAELDVEVADVEVADVALLEGAAFGGGRAAGRRCCGDRLWAVGRGEGVGRGGGVYGSCGRGAFLFSAKLGLFWGLFFGAAFGAALCEALFVGRSDMI